jgi:hypothetical protein
MPTGSDRARRTYSDSRESWLQQRRAALQHTIGIRELLRVREVAAAQQHTRVVTTIGTRPTLNSGSSSAAQR